MIINLTELLFKDKANTFLFRMCRGIIIKYLSLLSLIFQGNMAKQIQANHNVDAKQCQHI